MLVMIIVSGYVPVAPATWTGMRNAVIFFAFVPIT